VSFRKLFRSACERSARSFFANAVRRNTGNSVFVEEVNNPRSSAFAASFQAPPKLPNAASSGNQITSGRIRREMCDERFALVVIQQLLDTTNEFGRLNDSDERRR
jgi:hypothetical protein